MKKIKTVLVVLGVLVCLTCAAKGAKDYISALPAPLDVTGWVKAAQDKSQFEVALDPVCKWEKLAIPGGVLTTPDGKTMKLEAGVLISNCKAAQLIEYKSAAEKFYVERNQVALVYASLDQGCRSVERTLHDQLVKCEGPSLWEDIDFEAGVLVGAALCVGTTYAIVPAVRP